MRKPLVEISFIGYLVVRIEECPLASSLSIAIIPLIFEAVFEFVDSVTMLFTIDKITFVSASWLLQSSISIKEVLVK
jgi:hypothetical protein